MAKESVENGGRERDFVDPDYVKNFAKSVGDGIGEQVDKKEEEREKEQNMEQSSVDDEKAEAKADSGEPPKKAPESASQTPPVPITPEPSPDGSTGTWGSKNELLSPDQLQEQVSQINELLGTVETSTLRYYFNKEFFSNGDSNLYSQIIRETKKILNETKTALNGKKHNIKSLRDAYEKKFDILHDIYLNHLEGLSKVFLSVELADLDKDVDEQIEKLSQEMTECLISVRNFLGKKRDLSKKEAREKIDNFFKQNDVLNLENKILEFYNVIKKQKEKKSEEKALPDPTNENTSESKTPPPIPENTLKENLEIPKNELGALPEGVTLKDLEPVKEDNELSQESEGEAEIETKEEKKEEGRDVTPEFEGNSWSMAFLRWIGAGRFAHNLDAVKFRNMIKNMSAFSTIKKAESDYLNIVKRIETFRRAMINTKNLALESSKKGKRKLSVRRAISKTLSSTEGEVNGNALIQDVVPTEEADLDSSLINAYEGQYEEIRKKMNGAIAEREEMANKINQMKKNFIDVVEGYCTSVIEYENLDEIKQRFDTLSKEKSEQERESEIYYDAINKLSRIINTMSREGFNPVSYQRCVERLQNLQNQLFVMNNNLSGINKAIKKVERKMNQINDRVNALKSIRYDLGLDFEKRPTVYENDITPTFKEIMQEIEGENKLESEPESESEPDEEVIAKVDEPENGGDGASKVKPPKQIETPSISRNIRRSTPPPSYSGGYEGRESRTPKYRKKSLLTRFLGLFFRKR